MIRTLLMLGFWTLLAPFAALIGIPWTLITGNVEFLYWLGTRIAWLEHPVTGQFSWFNQIAFLNEWTLDPEIREYLVDFYGTDGLPFNTRFGGGDPIGPEIVQQLNDVYERHTLREPWQPGDLLLVDNVRYAHGREPYEGDREVLVALADALSLSDCEPTAEVTAR